MDAWLDVEANARAPYPSTDELAALADKAKLEVSQVDHWLKRRRKTAYMDPRIKKYFDCNPREERVGTKPGVSTYTCHRCGHNGHQRRTCPLADDELEELIEQGKAFDPKTLILRYPNPSCPDWPECVDLCGIQSSIRLQFSRVRPLRREFFCSPSRTRREQSIRPKISQNDVDLTEIESFGVWPGPPNQWLESTQVTPATISRSGATS